jgi:hypothetical protein
MLLFNVPSFGEDVTVGGLQLVGAWPQHFRDDVRSLPGWGELATALVKSTS